MAGESPVLMLARSRWWAVIAVVTLGVTAAMTGLPGEVAEQVRRLRTHLAVEQLIAALGPERLPAVRFSALGVSGRHSAMRSPPAVELTVEANAGRVIAIASGSSSPGAVAATAAALVVEGKVAGAIALLEEAVARTPGEARLWNDLAAADLEGGHLLRALVAADEALRLEPGSVTALYHRALALDRLGLSVVAAEAWKACLDAAPDPELATIVRERLRAGEATSEGARWQTVEKEFLDSAAAGDEAVVSRIAAESPRLVRALADATYLGAWADAFQNGDAATADRWLRVTRTAGAALRRRGETMVAEAVGAIDEARAQNDAERLRHLVAGHLAYDRGRRAYGSRDYAEAEPELRAAAAAFTAGHSPMRRVAESWTASVLIDSSRNDEADRMLSSLLAAEPPDSGHRALIAGSEYLLALCETLSARWDAAVDATKKSAELFRQIGETSNAAISENLLADILDLVGQADAGWIYRVSAFRTTNDTGVLNRLLVSVGGGTRAAIRSHQPDLALSMLDVEMSLADRVRDPVLTADMLTRRALLQHERGAPEDCNAALARARIAVTAIGDVVERGRLTVELDSAEAVIAQDSDPRRAVDLLSHAISFCSDTDRRIYLPSVLLQRGRAYLAAGQADRAWSDFSAAMDQLDAQRGRITNLELRSRFLDTAEELFDAAIALQVSQGDAEAAFRVAERARARSLLDVIGGATAPVVSSATVAARLDPSTVILEYAVLPEQVVLFSIGSRGMRMHTIPVKAGELTPERKDLASLLLRPVDDDLTASTQLIVIPDKILQRVAFSALRWKGRYLAQTHAIGVVPSASVLVAHAAAKHPAERVALIVGNGATDPGQNLDPLPAVDREVESIAATYRPARLLLAAQATKSRFTREAPAYDVIHFAGHGLSSDDSLTASLLFAPDGRDPGRMYMNDIARLRLPRAPLVVLGACGSLRGKAAGMEGMPSLARSFLVAGASTVVGTLWDIEDARAAVLLTSFHRHIAEGEAPAVALRSAQMEAIARGGTDADPKNWAAYVAYTVRL
jgi:tetratricopeptide (TPR) repeat protein